MVTRAVVATTGCGPKMARQEALSQIEECQQAVADAASELSALSDLDPVDRTRQSPFLSSIDEPAMFCPFI